MNNKNLYCNPEAFDCEVLWEWDEPNMCYEWSMAIIYKHTPSGKLYVASGSGCSCNGPSDDIGSLKDCEEVNTLGELEEALAWKSIDPASLAEAMNLVNNHLSGRV